MPVPLWKDVQVVEFLHSCKEPRRKVKDSRTVASRPLRVAALDWWDDSGCLLDWRDDSGCLVD